MGRASSSALALAAIRSVHVVPRARGTWVLSVLVCPRSFGGSSVSPGREWRPSCPPSETLVFGITRDRNVPRVIELLSWGAGWGGRGTLALCLFNSVLRGPLTYFFFKTRTTGRFCLDDYIQEPGAAGHDARGQHLRASRTFREADASVSWGGDPPAGPLPGTRLGPRRHRLGRRFPHGMCFFVVFFCFVLFPI